MKKAVRDVFKILVVLLVAMIAVIGILSRFGHSIEDFVYGVVYDEVQMAKAKTLPGGAVIVVSGKKVRSCLLTSARAEVLRDDTWVPGSVQMMKVDGSSLPISEQHVPSGARFVRNLLVEPIGTQVRLVAEVRCHPFWMTTQDFGVLETPAR